VNPSQKSDIFLAAAEILERHSCGLARYMNEETGADAFWSPGFNISVAADRLGDVACRLGSIEDTIPTSGSADIIGLASKESYGVVLEIAPWHVMLAIFKSV
jgi:acyl-CoA reductase-like NAD-dependent aldehyde dehydrogenase